MSGVFDPHVYIQTVTIVGIGGTGAQVARIVGRMIYDMQRSRKHTPKIVLIDPDIIEERNIGRQLFSPSLLGKYKAECVGKMLNLALGLDVRWIPEQVDAVRHFDRHGSNLVVSCVDNYQARIALNQVKGCGIYAGNHADAGQVCIGNTNDPDHMRHFLNGREGRYPVLPKEGLLFPDLLQPEVESLTPTPHLSCAELVASADQHLLVNDFMATVVGQYIYKLLHREPITTFLTFINTTDLAITSKAICREELSVYLPN